MVKTYKLEKINHAIEIASCMPLSWFRGHSSPYGELTPSLFRPPYATDWRSGSELEAFELEITDGFKRGAPTLTSHLPNYEDGISWLFLMQHHGMPTRLLDWSRNILVALYFAVFEKYNEDGELWVIYPGQLNIKSYGLGMPLPNNRILEYLVKKANLNEKGKKKFFEDKGISSKPTKPMALQPVLNFPRMISQMSTFTLHGEQGDENRIETILDKEEEIVRYVIPKSNKWEIHNVLFSLGITPVTLFPDLDRLSKDLLKRAQVFAYNPPLPPKCGGEIR